MASTVAAWPTVALGEVLTQYTNFVDVPEAREYPKLSVKLYGKGVVLDAPADGALLKMQRHQIARAGQVILSEIWGKKGAIGIVPAEGDGALCTSHFFLFDINLNKLDPRWLQAVFSANYLQEQLDGEARGTTGYAAVRPKHLLSATIPLPPLDEQRRIVARIEALAGRIAEARGLRQAARAEAEALAAIAYDAEYNRLSNAGYRTTSVSEYAELVTSGPRNFGSRYTQSGLRFYRAQDITRYGRVVEDPVVYVETPEGMTTRAVVETGDILIVITGATIGRSAVVLPHHSRGLVSQHVGLVRVDKMAVNPRFLHYCILAPSWAGGQLNTAQYGQGKPGLNLANLRALRFPLPPMAEQQRTVEYLDNVTGRHLRLKHVQAETQAELDTLLPAILDRAFRGEL